MPSVYQTDLASIRAERTTLLAASDRTTKSLERVSLQYDTLKSTHDDLLKKYAESEASVASLRRQVDKWTSLESRENADLESLRKVRIELEVKVKQLETEKAEGEAEKAAQDALVQKLQRKVDKYKESWTAHAVGALVNVACKCADGWPRKRLRRRKRTRRDCRPTSQMRSRSRRSWRMSCRPRRRSSRRRRAAHAPFLLRHPERYFLFICSYLLSLSHAVCLVRCRSPRSLRGTSLSQWTTTMW